MKNLFLFSFILFGFSACTALTYPAGIATIFLSSIGVSPGLSILFSFVFLGVYLILNKLEKTEKKE